MPSHDSCCAVGCTNRRGKPKCKGLQFYTIPKDTKVRSVWLARINRSDLREQDVTSNTCLCSAHFHLGRKTKEQALPVKFSHATFPLSRKPPCRKETGIRPETSTRVDHAVKRRHPESEVGSCDTEPTPKRARINLEEVQQSGIVCSPQMSTQYQPEPDDVVELLHVSGCHSEEPCATTTCTSAEWDDHEEQPHTNQATKSDKITFLESKIYLLEGKLLKHESKCCPFDLSDEEQLPYYTGLPSLKVFQALLNLLRPHFGKIYSKKIAP